MLFENGRYDSAANYYAQSHYSFERVTIKYLTKNVQSYLVTYLLRVLEIYQKSKL